MRRRRRGRRARVEYHRGRCILVGAGRFEQALWKVGANHRRGESGVVMPETHGVVQMERTTDVIQRTAYAGLAAASGVVQNRVA